jgi:hypothetical protein
MKILFYFILLISLFSCQENTNKIDTSVENTVDTLSTSNLEDTSSSSSANKAPITFREMPSLATYINELPFYEHEFPLKKATERLAFRADTIHFLEEEEGDYSYYYKLDHFTQKQAQFVGGWYGTAGEQDWKASYQLLNDNKEAPIVLLAVQSKETFGGYQADLESNYSELEEMVEAGNTSIDVENLADIARGMSSIGRRIASLDNDSHIHDLRFWVWQKQKGQWKNISSEVFKPEMYTNLTASFPFLEQRKVDNPLYPGFFLEERMYSEQGMAQNQANWKHWFGVDKLNEIDIDLSLNAQAIQLEISKNKTIRWDWNGEHFTLNNLPTPIAWKDEPCSIIDYSSNKEHAFEGDIAGISIKMNVRLNENKITGNYWYTKNPSTLFPIEGSFIASTEAALKFYRMKKGEKREYFYAYFADCQFKGWWQHQATMEVEEFSLKLVP